MSNAIENNIKITFSTSELSPDTKATLIYSHSKDVLVSSDETLFDENLFGAIYVTDKGDIVFTKDNADKHSLNTVTTAMLSNATVLSPEIANGVFSANDRTSVVLHRSLQDQTLTIVWHNLYISSETGDEDINFAVTMTGFQDGTLQLDAQLQPLKSPHYEKSTAHLSEANGSADTILQNDGYVVEDAGAEKENQVSSEEGSALFENTQKAKITENDPVLSSEPTDTALNDPSDAFSYEVDSAEVELEDADATRQTRTIFPNLLSGLGGELGYGENSYRANVGNPADDGSYRIFSAGDAGSLFANGVTIEDQTYKYLYFSTNGAACWATDENHNWQHYKNLQIHPDKAIFAAFFTDIGLHRTDEADVLWDFDQEGKRIVITWYKAPAYHTDSILGENTFQIIFTEKEDNSFTVAYKYGQIEFANGNTGGSNAVIGIMTNTSTTELPASGNVGAIENLATTTPEEGNGTGSVLWGVESSEPPVITPADGIVRGTTNSELINSEFTDNDGDQIDATESKNDTVYGDGGNDTIYAGLGHDSVDGGEDHDKILGEDGNDTLDGGLGNDTISGGAGEDRMTGGDGNDTFIYAEESGNDTITDFSENDFVDLSQIYNETTVTSDFNNALHMLREDADDGKLDGQIEGQTINSISGKINLTLLDGANSAISSSALTAETTGVICFCKGTKVTTGRGEIKVENLKSGDLIKTLDHGMQPLSLVLKRIVTPEELKRNSKLYPIKFNKGSLGNGLPKRALKVSRQHRLVLTSLHQTKTVEDGAILLAAIHLVELPGVSIFKKDHSIEYYHLVSDKHEIIFAEGCKTESFFPGKIAIKSLSHCARVKLFSHYNQIDLTKMAKNPARKMLIGKSAKLAVFKVLLRLGRSKKMQLNRPLAPAAANLMNKVS
jgi:Ca2+-binding RTX toxin-like protein